MAGGSALALQLGHRVSLDFDFFSEGEFNSSQVNSSLNAVGKYSVSNETPKTMVGIFNDVKFSLFHYPYPLIAQTKKFLRIGLSSLEDIAAMKLVAITDRATKKDYIDLFVLAKKYPIEHMFDFYEKKYHLLQPNLFTLIKSLQFFSEAEETDMPKMIEKINWEGIKKFFQKEVIKLAEKYL
ncbi:MAG: nucleotidyl transferase AbiEii/AbiGii toxin family protein [Patescibacteria group bacterium]